MNFKPAYSFIEVIISIMIISIVSISAIYIYKDFASMHQKEYNNELLKIEWLNTKYFLQNNLNSSNQLTLQSENLYFENNLLLHKVQDFSLKNSSEYFEIYFCIQNKLCNTMVIKK